MKSWKRIVWRRTQSITEASKHAPTLSGVYAIARSTTVANLPKTLDWVYVGKSKNLRQRLNQHGPILETHLEMRDWITRNDNHIETWFTLLELEEANALERFLIQKLEPQFNRMSYKTKGE